MVGAPRWKLGILNTYIMLDDGALCATIYDTWYVMTERPFKWPRRYQCKPACPYDPTYTRVYILRESHSIEVRFVSVPSFAVD